jgi:hypothetical protein
VVGFGLGEDTGRVDADDQRVGVAGEAFGVVVLAFKFEFLLDIHESSPCAIRLRLHELIVHSHGLLRGLDPGEGRRTGQPPGAQFVALDLPTLG